MNMHRPKPGAPLAEWEAHARALGRHIERLCDHNAELVRMVTAEDGSDLPPARELAAERDRLLAERDRYRVALRRIADANSGTWGWIAHDALRGKAA